MTRSILLSCGYATSAALLFSVASCGKSESAKPDAKAGPTTTQPVAVRVVTINRDPIPDTVDFIGTLYGDEEAQIASKASGRIVEVRADLGDRVDEGALLARVDPTDYQLAIRQKEAALNEALSKVGLTDLPPSDFDPSTVATVRRASVQADNAKARLDRAKQLFEQPQPLISPQEYADTETQYQVAKQDYDVALLDVKSSVALAQSRAEDLKAAKQFLADTEIRAPRSSITRKASTQPATTSIEGRWAIAERRTSVGEYVQAGTVVYKLIADQPIKLRASIPERFQNRVKPGQSVTLNVESGDALAKGAVSRVSPAVDVASRTFGIEVTFPNTRRLLKPGSFARGTVTVGERTDVSTVPASALYSFAGLDKVFTVKDGKAISNVVSIVSRGTDRVVVEGNLGGATEAIEGSFAKLASGVPITTQPTTKPAK